MIRPNPNPTCGPACDRRRLRDDDGVISVMMALTLVAMMAISAVVIDGGRAYSSRRLMQNASDSATMAGLRALDKAKFPTGTPDYSAVLTAVNTELTAHGASLTTASSNPSTCYLVDSSGSRLSGSPTCSTSGVTNFQSQAVGIEVTAYGTETAFLGAIVNQKTVTVSATATATMQPFQGGTGSPFVICGKPSVNPASWPILNADNSLNTTAIATMGDKGDGIIEVQGSQLSKDHGCGAPRAWKGKIEDVTDPINVGGLAVGDNGNGASFNIAIIVASATPCTPQVVDDCDILLPVADYANGYQFHVVAWVSAHIQPGSTGLGKYTAKINTAQSQNLVAGGSTSAGTVNSAATPRVLKLQA